MCKVHECFIILILISVTDVFCIGSKITTQGSVEDLIKSTQTKSCRIPSAPNTIHYQKKSDSEKDVLLPNSAVDGNGAVVHIECHGIARENTSWHGEHYMVCYDGKWYPPNNVCIKLCPALILPNSVLKCTLNDEPVSCEENIRPRTIANRTCKSGHMDDSNAPLNFCKDNGEWNHNYIDCYTDCGEIDTEYQPNGSEHDNLVVSPWKAGLYKKKNESEEFEFICGATLIGTESLVTAARCVRESDGSLIRNDLLRVGLGKSYMLWNDPRDIHSQKYEVATVTDEFLHVLLAGNQVSKLQKSLEFLKPISFIFLKGRIEFTSFVRPICSDSQGLNSQIEHLNGTMYGWDRNGNHSLYRSLLYTNEECKTLISNMGNPDELNKEMKKFGRFCTDRVFPEFLHGSSVFYHNGTVDAYYLIGVLIGIHDSISVFQGMRDREAALSMFAYYNNLIRIVRKEPTN
ncbi:hypothetical protein LSTR_LSTR004410 [Laodelphax striatellus]|uniref:Peptidase S1 domain-containing protein n=1 Tax=Laodelphax striatellus TaxID=195883 RepID=A0A482XB26_LAOST|nr:hypothetical protein LSTR_LSTR004410 [Laodelphax striatellus]